MRATSTKPGRMWIRLIFLGVFTLWMTGVALRDTLLVLQGGHPYLAAKYFGPSRTADSLYLIVLWASLFLVWWPAVLRRTRLQSEKEKQP